MSLCPVDKKLTSTLSMNKLFAHLLSIWKEHPLSHSSWILLYGFLKEKDILSSSHNIITHSETLKETRRAQHKVCNSYFPPWAQITFIQCLYSFPDPRLRVALKAQWCLKRMLCPAQSLFLPSVHANIQPSALTGQCPRPHFPSYGSSLPGHG